jgi:hypothetical protein
LTIAVAFTTDGIAVPNTCGLLGSRSAEVLFGAAGGLLAFWAIAVVASASVSVANANRARGRKNSEAADTNYIPLLNNH